MCAASLVHSPMDGYWLVMAQRAIKQKMLSVRTSDLRVTSALLYQLSYNGVYATGAGDGNRTHVISLGS